MGVVGEPAILVSPLMPDHVYSFLANPPAAWLRSHGGLPDSIADTSLSSPDGVPREVQRLLLREVVIRAATRPSFPCRPHSSLGASRFSM